MHAGEVSRGVRGGAGGGDGDGLGREGVLGRYRVEAGCLTFMLDVIVVMAIAVTYCLGFLHGWFSCRLEDLEIGFALPFGDDGDDGVETLHVAAWERILGVDVWR